MDPAADRRMTMIRADSKVYEKKSSLFPAGGNSRASS